MIGVATLTPLSSTFFTSGEAPGFAGDATGEATGLLIGLAGATGAGVGVGLFGAGVFAVELQAPITATLAAKTVDNINDLLIVFLLMKWTNADQRRPPADIPYSRMDEIGSFTVPLGNHR